MKDITTPPAAEMSDTSARLDTATRRRRDRKLYVRVTEDERRRILERAYHAHLSISRYLARLGLDGKAPPGPEERQQREAILLVFRRSWESLLYLEDRLDDREIRHLVSDCPGVIQDITTARETLEDVIRAISQRL
jgi:hypothetical protein